MNKNYIPVAMALVLLAGLAGAQGSSNVDLINSIPLPTGTCADVWADGDLVFLARRGEGIEIIDMTDPAAPQTLFAGYDDLFVQDVKTQGNLLVFSNESGNGQAVYLLDISNPSTPTLHASYGDFLNLITCHNTAFFGNYLYCCSLISNKVVILDVSNPASPQEVGTIDSQAPLSSVHDVAVVDGKLYTSWLSGGFEIHDVAANPANPPLVLHHQTPTSFFHNTWPLEDGIHVATTQEAAGGYLEIWDVSNPLNVVQKSQWRASMAAVMHNLLIQDNFAFITNYTEGLRVVDVKNPSLPVEVGFYDTFTGVNPFTFGAWGVFPFDRSRVYVADFSSGLYVLDFKPLLTTIQANQASYVGGEVIALTLGLTNASPANEPVLIDLSLEIPALGPGSFSLLSFQGIMPAGASATGPYFLPLPSVVPPLAVTFTASAATPSNEILFDAASVTVNLQ